MSKLSCGFALLGGLLLAAAPARAAIEDSYQSGDPPITTTWYGWADPAAQAADRRFVAGMRPHHVGAITMSEAYLADPERRSPLLRSIAQAIIANQRFEIAMLDGVRRNLEAPPLRLPFGLVLQPVATEGLTGLYRFFRQPVPSPLDAPVAPVSRRDVEFAKAMIVHHQAAVTMAGDYLRDPAATNGYLGLMNVDIRTDQTQEIALMRLVVEAFPDAASVIVDPAMIHGMEGMHAEHAAMPVAAAGASAEAGDHAGHHGGAAAPKPAPSQQQRPATPPARRPAKPAAPADHTHNH
jgi:uncharacterized protein (DUF305 family)